jgi:N-acetylglutamate synthase-like GNAT family acetyltransferase
MENEIKIRKPEINDSGDIREILSQWTEPEEVNSYVERINNEINGKTEFNMEFWIIEINKKLAGVIGLSEPLPKVLPLAKTQKPAEIKILYIKDIYRGQNLGRMLVDFIEDEARRQGYSELIVRSAAKYKETAFGFYKKLGYINIGQVSSGENKIMEVFEKILT